MSEKDVERFKTEGRLFLNAKALASLRSYAREIGVDKPTKDKNKPELIEFILAVLTGEVSAIEKSKFGAPVKSDIIDPTIPKEMERLRTLYLEETTGAEKEESPSVEDFEVYFAKELSKMRARAKSLYFSDSYSEMGFEDTIEERTGQLATINSVPLLLPLDCIDSDEKVVVSVELARKYDLREGDIVSSCVRRRNGVLIAVRFISINGEPIDDFRRIRFEEGLVCYPTEQINFYKEENFAKTEHKFFDWIAPVYRGQRALVAGSPKSGKTKLLQELAISANASNEYFKVFVLQVDQTLETVNAFRKIFPKGNFVYTTYEDDPDRQVFAAEFLLNRAKRYVECGRNVLLVVDSFNALAHAYNETDASSGGKMLPCGLESKTVHYIKKYFGAGRSIERSGSLTILGSIATSTGNPADDYLAAELSSLSNLKVTLSDSMAAKHVYPALDPTQIQREGNETGKKEKFLRSKILPVYTEDVFLKKLNAASSYKDFCESVKGY